MSKFASCSGFLTWLMALLLSALVAGCGGGGGGGRAPILGGGGIAGLAPVVTVVTPLPNAIGVPINTKIITAAFTKAMDPATLTPASFTLACPAGTPVTGAVAYLAAGNVATLTLPTAPNLPLSTVCTATVTTGAKDTTGIPLASNFVWTFTTGVALDITAPTVTSTVPLANATGVAFNTLVTASFSEPMDPSTIATANFTLACPAGTAITGTVAYAVNGNAATFRPASNLPASTICTATITTGVKDVAGNAMASAFTWTFTTSAAAGGAALDTTAPTVSSTVPAAGATAVVLNTLINATFSEPMDPLTITNANFTLVCPAGTAITGTVTYAVNGNVANFRPASNLPAGTACTATIATGVKDVAGNAMATAFIWTFTTSAAAGGAALDTTAPTVSSTVPLANATGVALNTRVTASFSEPMDPLTITSANFTLACPAGTTITGTVGYVTTGNVATFIPASNLPASTTCTATITTGVRDVAGNAMASVFTWTFTTGAAADTTRPGVMLTVPATTIPGPTAGVPTNSAITAVFTEDMAPATIVAAGTFTVTCAAPCVSPAGATVTYIVGSRTAVFTPAAALAAGTTYTATITTAATDLAGNQLAGNQAPLPAASNYVWTFTTAAAPVPPAPVSVLSTNPLAAAVGVCPGATINATFTVPSGLRMDPLTVNAATFTVTGPALTPVTATSVALDVPTGRIATFTPLSALTAGVLYTATIKGGATGVKDLAIPANTMAVDFTWTFTAGPATGACLAPIALNSASTFGDFGGSAGMTNSGLLTVINGDIGTTAVSTAVTGFHDAGPGCTYTETPLNVGTVNGKIYTAPPPPTVACPTEGTGTAAPQTGTFGIATQARADALAAYNALVALPPGANPGANLAGLTLAPGVYTAPAGSFLIQTGNASTAGDLTLDAQGNANAVWVFQMATTLTVGGPGAAFPRSVNLINGGQAKNVFWQVGSFATINAAGGGTMVGTIISQAGAAFSTAGNVNIVTLNGRALSLGASVTLVDTVINVPAP